MQQAFAEDLMNRRNNRAQSSHHRPFQRAKLPSIRTTTFSVALRTRRRSITGLRAGSVDNVPSNNSVVVVPVC
jgi:hypothetical protein